MSINEYKFSEPTDGPALVPGVDEFNVAPQRQFAGRRFITPRRLVIECLKEVHGELQCRYITKNPDGNSVDFTVAAARKILIPV